MTYQDGSTTAYTWDAGNRLTQVVDSISGTITRTYDGLDRPTQEVTPQGTVSYAYDSAGRRTTMTVLGQPTVNYTYDNADRLTQIAQGTSTVSLAYDNASRRTSLTLPNGVITDSAYDAASRLTGQTYRTTSTTLGTLTYTYDAAGNRSQTGGTWARTGLPSAVSSATYNAANHQLTFGGQTLTYDLNGNLTSDGTTSYTWDVRNRLASLSGPGTTASFQYDPLGRRTRKVINGTTTDFLHDGVNPVQELSGGSPLANILTGLAVDEYLTRTDSAGSRHFLTDVLGGTLALTDPAGAVQTQYTYEPFGATTTTGPTSANPFQYTGRESDGPTGLYFYRERYYSPTLHRFIGEDPIRLASGDVNFYAYVGSNPVNFIDPDGLAVVASIQTPSYCVERPAPPPSLGGRKALSRLERFKEVVTGLGYGALNLYLDFACDPSAGIPGPAAVTGPTAGMIKHFEQQLAKHGAKSLERSLRSLEKRLLEHLEKLPQLKHKSYVEKEIRNFQAQIEAIKQIERSNP